LREGAKGPLVYEFACKRVWLPRKGKISMLRPRISSFVEGSEYQIK